MGEGGFLGIVFKIIMFLLVSLRILFGYFLFNKHDLKGFLIYRRGLVEFFSLVSWCVFLLLPSSST